MAKKGWSHYDADTGVRPDLRLYLDHLFNVLARHAYEVPEDGKAVSTPKDLFRTHCLLFIANALLCLVEEMQPSITIP